MSELTQKAMAASQSAESRAIPLISRAACAIAFTATLFAATSAAAITPFQAASLAYRGQLEGIAGYQTLELNIRTGRVTGEDVLEAAGLEVNQSDARFIETILRDDNVH